MDIFKWQTLEIACVIHSISQHWTRNNKYFACFFYLNIESNRKLNSILESNILNSQNKSQSACFYIQKCFQSDMSLIYLILTFILGIICIGYFPKKNWTSNDKKRNKKKRITATTNCKYILGSWRIHYSNIYFNAL